MPDGLDYAAIDPRVARLHQGFGRVFVRADGAAQDFTTGAVPSQATGDRLTGWEDACGLPDPEYPTVDPANSIYKGVAFGAFTFNDPRSDSTR